MRFFLPHLLLLSLVFGGATAHSITVPATEDTYSSVGKIAPRNGKATTISLAPTKKGYVRFDLATLPAAVDPAFVTAARLRLYVASVKVVGTPMTVSQITNAEAWHEDPATTALEPVAATPAITTVNVTKAKRFLYIDVTDAVLGWLANPASNGGFALSTLGSILLGAKEGTGTGYPAELEIDVDLAAATLNASGQIDGGTIAPGSVGSSQLAPSSVVTLGLADDAVTAAKIAANSIGTAQIIDGKVTAEKLAAGSVTAAALADGSVTSAKLALDCAVFFEEESPTTNQGVAATGWNLRELNGGTIVGTSIGRVGDTITLAPGTYYIEGEAIGFAINRHQIILRDITSGSSGAPTNITAVVRGITAFSSETAGYATSASIMRGIVTVSGTARNFQLWHYVALNPGGQSFGASRNADAVNNRYSQVSVVRIK